MACGPRVAVQVPAAPAVQIQSVHIQVTAADRECRPLANEVAAQINAIPGMRVDPRAKASLTVYGCTTTIGPDQGGTTALAAFSDRTGIVHLLGTAREPHGRRLNATVASLNRQAAADLVEQVVPVPLVVQRRVYDVAGKGSARALLNRAVRAEQRGDLARALDYATRANDLRPRPERARYVAELARRLARQE